VIVISYCLFALLVVGATMVKRRVPRQLMLLAASYLFYSTWGLAFLAILVSSSLFNFFYGEFLKRRPSLGRLAGGVADDHHRLHFAPLYHGQMTPAAVPVSWQGR